VLWGQHPHTRQPILWDRWAATNPHMVVIGESGAGTTYHLSGLLVQEWALGDEALLILDPKLQEYRQLVRNLGGAYISLSGRAQHRINPLDLPALTSARLAQLEALDTDLLGERITFVRALIEQELRAQGTPLDGTSLALLERALRMAYDRRGITADPRTFTEERPTFTDVHAALVALADQDTDARDLARALANFCRGTTIGNLFDYPSNIPVNPLLALDLSTLLRSQDQQLERLLPQVVMDFFVTRAIEQPSGRARSHLLLDEAHTLLQTAAGSHTLELIFRIGRSMGFAGTVITQGIADLDGSDRTRVLLENSRTKLLLGVNRESGAVGRVAEIVGLNEAEQAYYAQCRLIRGAGALALLLADGQRTQLFVPPWPQTIERAVVGDLHA
jgi:type IV secretory pathway VirB4 component